MEQDLLNPLYEDEKAKHKLHRLVQAPNSFFMDIKCSGCPNITTIFSHAQSTITCENCSAILCKSTGGKVKLTPGSQFRFK